MKPTKQGDKFQINETNYTVDKFMYGVYDKSKLNTDISFYNSLQELIDANLPEFDGANIYVRIVETGGLISYNDILYQQ